MYIGIDVGSISLKTVIIDKSGKIIFSDYFLHNSRVDDALELLTQKLTKNSMGRYNHLCVTGSGRKIANNSLNADLMKNEITANWRAAIEDYPDIKTIIEIGGQDSKLIIINNKELTNFRLNSVCAAGTGSFLQQQSSRIGIPLSEFSSYATKAEIHTKFSGRCSVFIETEMINLQQKGFSLFSIVSGLIDAVCDNYIKDLGHGTEIKEKAIFCGGVSDIIAIKNSFEKKLGINIIVPSFNKISAAYGAALLSLDYGKNLTIEKSLTYRKKTIMVKQCEESDCLACGKCGLMNKQ